MNGISWQVRPPSWWKSNLGKLISSGFAAASCASNFRKRLLCILASIRDRPVSQRACRCLCLMDFIIRSMQAICLHCASETVGPKPFFHSEDSRTIISRLILIGVERGALWRNEWKIINAPRHELTQSMRAILYQA